MRVTYFETLYKEHPDELDKRIDLVLYSKDEVFYMDPFLFVRTGDHNFIQRSEKLTEAVLQSSRATFAK